MSDEVYTRVHEDFYEQEYCKDIDLRLRVCSLNKECLKDIEEQIFQFIKDNGFEEICWFEKRD